jgi:hypothetical protein
MSQTWRDSTTKIHSAEVLHRLRSFVFDVSAPANANGADTTPLPVSPRKQSLRDRLARTYLAPESPE